MSLMMVTNVFELSWAYDYGFSSVFFFKKKEGVGVWVDVLSEIEDSRWNM